MLTQERRRQTMMFLLGLMGATGCGGGGSDGGTQSRPTVLLLGTPTSVTGQAANGLAFTFGETLTTISGQPAVAFTLHEVNNGTSPVTVAAGQDPATQALFPVTALQILDPQGRPVSLPPLTGSQTLTLNPGDTADTSRSFSVGTFPTAGRYQVTITASGTQGVPALSDALVFTAD